MSGEIEKRAVKAEIRALEANGEMHIVGYSPVYGVRSSDLGGFVEIIAPGALKNVDMSDVRGTFDHDELLARGKNGTLSLADEASGLRYDILINPDDPEAVSAYAKVKRGDVDGSSFMFTVANDKWEQLADGTIVRTVLQIGELLDVGPVCHPAYPQASASARSMALALSGRAMPPDNMTDVTPEGGQEAAPESENGGDGGAQAGENGNLLLKLELSTIEIQIYDC